MSSRSMIQRGCAVALLVALSAFLFYVGKGHTILLDTRTATIEGEEYRSPETVEVIVDGGKAETMGRAERVMLTVAGPRHTISIESLAADGKIVKRGFSLPTFGRMSIVSIPAIFGGADERYWTGPFTPPTREATPAERMQRQEDEPASPPAKP